MIKNEYLKISVKYFKMKVLLPKVAVYIYIIILVKEEFVSIVNPIDHEGKPILEQISKSK